MQQKHPFYRARAPLRLGLAGGGTDVSPYCDAFGGYVLNATIDRYAYAILTPHNKNVVSFHATDRQQAITLPLKKPMVLDGTLNIHKGVYNHIMEHYNEGKPLPLDLRTFCDAPIGSGLGASSTLVVAMLKAFVEYLNLPLDDYAIAQTAFHIEREKCCLQGGRQDQYSAAFGGFNFMEFYADRTLVNPLRIKQWILCELESSLLLYFTGVSRESAAIIREQSNSLLAGAELALAAMHKIKAEALTMKECLLRANFNGLIDSCAKAGKVKNCLLHWYHPLTSNRSMQRQ